MLNWLYAAIFGAGILAGAGLAYYIVHSNNKIEFQALQLKLQTQQTVSVTTSLNKLQGWIAANNLASSDFQRFLANQNNQYTDLRGRLNEIARKNPLPLDCRPGAARLSIINSAVNAANTPAPASP